jgi:Transcription antiterminator
MLSEEDRPCNTADNIYSDKWYAVFVKTGQEDKVKEKLQYCLTGKNVRVLVPKRRLLERKNGNWGQKIRILFPGYVFLNGPIGIEEYYSLKKVPGLIRVLKDGHGLLNISEQEITVISRLMCNGETVGSSNVMVNGSRIVVTDGPLLGLDGLIESINKRKGRARVRINLMNELRVVELAVSVIQLI